MLFDTHAHVLSADRDRYPYSTLRGGAKAPVSPVVFAVEDLVRAMDAGGVDHACIVQRATIYGYDNRYALDSVAAFPKRFVPIVVLDAQDTSSPATLKGLAAQRRLGGLRIVAPELTEKDTAWLDSEEALGLWRAASDLGLPVTVILYRRNNEAGLAALLGIARKFRDVPILVDHVGVPHASTPETRYAASQGIRYVVPPPPGFGIAEVLRSSASSVTCTSRSPTSTSIGWRMSTSIVPTSCARWRIASVPGGCCGARMWGRVRRRMPRRSSDCMRRRGC